MMKRTIAVVSAALLGAAAARGADIRIGVIGLDTSHAIAFVKAFNAPEPAPDLAGMRVTAAYPKGSADIVSSTNRVPDYIKQVEAMGVEIVDSIDALLARTDAILLESNDGRVHLEQALPVFRAGKRVFIDKPIAGSLAHVVAIFDAAARHKVPTFSSSAFRYTTKAQAVRKGDHGPVLGVNAHSACTLEPTHPDFFWYGVHGVELLFTLMGTGCESVSRVTSPGTDVAVGLWTDGRIGVFRGNRDSGARFGAEVFLKKGTVLVDDFDRYGMLVSEIARFFRTGVAPVSPEETLEVFAFMEAADESKRRGGAPVSTAEVLAAARKEAAKLKLD